MSSAAINPRLEIFDIPFGNMDDDADDSLSVEAYRFFNNNEETDPTANRSRADKRRLNGTREPHHYQYENPVLTVDLTDSDDEDFDQFLVTVTQETHEIDGEDRIPFCNGFELNFADFLTNGHPNGMTQAADCSKHQFCMQGDNNVVRDEFSQESSSVDLSRIRKEYAESRIIKSEGDDKHSEQLWAEFGELLRSAAASSQTAHLVTALVEEWRLLAKQAVRHTDESLRAKAQEIVQGRQKRRKTKRKGNADVKYQAIQPWHIVLGDRCTRDRTLGTLVLRFHCLQLKQSNRRIDCEQVLCRTRNFLRLAFPSEQTNEVGRILYVTGSRFVEYTSNLCEPVYAFGADEKITFGSVPVDHELDVVKLLYTKISATERSLEELVQAYRIALKDQQACASHHSVQAFESFLDFVSQAAAQDLTQTAINGLRESLDAKWDALFES